MAKTTHPSHCDIMISDTLHELEMKIDEAERIQEMIARLNCYDKGQKLPVEVVDFIGNYASIEIVSREGLLTEAGSILKKAFESLMVAIKWLIEKLAMIFKYLFNSEYRACKDALDLQRRFMTMSINRTLVNDFEAKPCSVIPKTDIDNIIFKTQKLVELVSNAAALSRQDFTDTLIQSYCTESGVKFDINTGRVTEDLPNPAPMSGTTFGTAGWTMQGITSSLSNYIATLKQIESLKQVSKDCDAAASDLKKRAEEASLSGAAAEKITELQKECATKICMTKVAGYAIAVCCRRSENILAFLNQLYTAAKEAK